MATSKTKLIGSVLPTAMQLKPPTGTGPLLAIDGNVGGAKVINGIAVTEVDAKEWDDFVKRVGDDFEPLRTGGIFVLDKEPTPVDVQANGFEPELARVTNLKDEDKKAGAGVPEGTGEERQPVNPAPSQPMTGLPAAAPIPSSDKPK